MKSLQKIFFTISFATLFLFTSCVKENDDLVPSVLIDPSDVQLLSRVIGLPEGSTRTDGDLPSAGLGNFTCQAIVNELVSSNGSSTPIILQCAGFQNNLTRIYIQVVGSSQFFIIPINGQINGFVNIPLLLPTNLLQGNFCVNVIAEDVNGNRSTIATQCINVLRLGTGSLQVSLSWNNFSDTDLHVEDPSGTNIYYANSYSSTGGELDRDDVDGFGPENIYWLNTAPDGIYKVYVHDYSGSLSTDFYVTVSSNGTSRSFSGNVSYNNRILVTTIEKTGSSISFR